MEFNKRMHLDLHSFVLIGFMSDDEYRVFLRIKAIMDNISASKDNKVSFNETFNNACWVIEQTEKGLETILVWSQTEEPLINFLKQTKNNLEEENKIKIQKNSNNLWEWTEPDTDYRFEFKSELAAYADCISYLKQVNELVDCSKQ